MIKFLNLNRLENLKKMEKLPNSLSVQVIKKNHNKKKFIYKIIE